MDKKEKRTASSFVLIHSILFINFLKLCAGAATGIELLGFSLFALQNVNREFNISESLPNTFLEIGEILAFGFVSNYIVSQISW